VGVLDQAIAVASPAVATRFPHSADLVADGANVIVNHQISDSTMVVGVPNHKAEVTQSTEIYLWLHESALTRDGLLHNCMNGNGKWIDAIGSGDWRGRDVWDSCCSRDPHPHEARLHGAPAACRSAARTMLNPR